MSKLLALFIPNHPSGWVLVFIRTLHGTTQPLQPTTYPHNHTQHTHLTHISHNTHITSHTQHTTSHTLLTQTSLLMGVDLRACRNYWHFLSPLVSTQNQSPDIPPNVRTTPQTSLLIWVDLRAVSTCGHEHVEASHTSHSDIPPNGGGSKSLHDCWHL